MDEAVRAQLSHDLHWILQAPALLPQSELGWHPGNGFTPDLVVAALNADGAALEQSRHGKLGHYFEAMVQSLFRASSHFDILASNCIIRGPTRTLGELDLLLEDRCHGRILHLELALKFYLLLPAQSDVGADCRWIGSGLRDFLTIKTQRLLTHQLRLPQLVDHEDAWPSNLPRPDVSLGWITGRAFVPYATQPDAESAWPLISPGALIRPWITESDAGRLNLSGRWINKSQWLSANPGPAETQRHPAPAQWLGRLPGDTDDGHWFIVPDDWPERAQASMLRRFAPETNDQGSPT